MNLDTAQLGPQDGQVTSAAVSGAASAAAAIPYVPASGGANRYLWVQAIGTVVNVVFGIGTGMGAPTVSANSLQLANGQLARWLIPVGCTHYRTIGAGAGFILFAPGAP